MKPRDRTPFQHAFRKWIDERTTALRMTTPKLVEKLGPDYRTFMYWYEGERNLPAELLPKLCATLENYELFDMLEREAGRIAFCIPQIEELPYTQDVRAVHRLVKEVGEALEALADTLKDGTVEDHELERTLPQLDNVITECARLKHFLKVRCQEDRKRMAATCGKVDSHSLLRQPLSPRRPSKAR